MDQVRTNDSSVADEYDIAVIGGGVSGLGVALEAKGRGYSVLLLERETCGSKTSSNSLRIIHGGFRYLQSLNFRRAGESARAQADLLRHSPTLVKELPCLMPLKRTGLKSGVPVRAALRLYQGIRSCVGAGTKRPGSVLSTADAEQRVPALAGQFPYGALEWFDAFLPDAGRFASSLKQELDDLGATILEDTEVVQVKRDSGQFQIKVQNSTGESEYRAAFVVDATGPWMRGGFLSGAKPVSAHWAKAFNLIVNKQLDPNYAVGVTSGSGRLYFLVPRNSGTAIGTFYSKYNQVPEEVEVSPDEIEASLQDLKSALPSFNVDPSNVIDIDVGVLPAKEIRPDGEPVLYGSEQIHSEDGFIQLLSTKYTTFQSQARKVIRVVESRRVERA